MIPARRSTAHLFSGEKGGINGGEDQKGETRPLFTSKNKKSFVFMVTGRKTILTGKKSLGGVTKQQDERELTRTKNTPRWRGESCQK